MNEQRWLARSERWLRILLRLYPVDFRDEMGDAVVNTYRERCRTALRTGGRLSLTRVWLRALWDSLRNGLGERVRPAASWRRSGNWGRDLEIATRRLVRAPMFMAAMVGTLTVGLGAFAVVYAVVEKVLIAPMAYERPDDLYFVWRDYGKIFDLKRGWLAGATSRRVHHPRRESRGDKSSRWHVRRADPCASRHAARDRGGSGGCGRPSD